MNHPISTFPRFIYLNAYAFLLIFLGIGIALYPFYAIHYICVVPQAIAVISCIKVAYRIFSTWDDKKRKYTVLMQRNTPGFRPDTFSEYMQAPCGRLLCRVVLHDMRKTDKYVELKHLKKPLRVLLHEGCEPKKTVVYINSDFVTQ